MHSKKNRNGFSILMLSALAAALVGAGLSAWLAYMHFKINTDPSYVSVCALGKTVNCETVAASSYSAFLGLPVAVWGVFAFLVAAWLSVFDLTRKDRGGAVGAVFALSSVMVLVSIALGFISAFAIGSVCVFCAAVYAASLALAVVVFFEVRGRGGILANVRDDLAAFFRCRVCLAASAVLVAIIIVVGPVGIFPRYWELASWRDGPSIPHGFDENGRPWLGAENPKITVHEYLDYECPHCHVAHRKLRRFLLNHLDTLRIVRHDYARMSCAPNDAVKRFSKCTAARAAHCAALKDRFWDWNDAVMADPKPLFGSMRNKYELNMAKMLGFDVEEFDKCLFAPETVDFAQREYKDTRKNGVRDTPMYRVGDQVYNLKALWYFFEQND